MACCPSSPTGESAVDPFCWTCQMSLFCAISSWFLKGLSSSPSRCCGVLHGRMVRALLTVPTATFQGVLQRALVHGGGQARQLGQPSSKKSWAEGKWHRFSVACFSFAVRLDLHSHLHWYKDDAGGMESSFTTMGTGRCPKRPTPF